MLHMMSRLNRFYRKKLIRWWILRFSYAAVDILHLDTGVGKPLGSTRPGQLRGGLQRLVRPVRACSPFPWGDIGYFSMSVYGA